MERTKSTFANNSLSHPDHLLLVLELKAYSHILPFLDQFSDLVYPIFFLFYSFFKFSIKALTS